MTDLGDRLRRLRRAAAPETPAPIDSGLERLERTVLGAPRHDLALKARLEGLLAASTRRAGSGARMEDLVDGEVVEGPHGAFFRVDTDRHLESRHGRVSLSRIRTLQPEAGGVLACETPRAPFDLARAVFLDTETTGLAGGSGTAAFLVGIGFVEDDRFRVRQYLMRDYNEEPALLHALAADLARFDRLVTFNGKLFDVPLLETRFSLCRWPFPLQAAEHLDLLHPARRLWKLRLDSCRLQYLEVELLGVRRVDDVPGERIPAIYFDYVRNRDARFMARVLEHNRLDIVSLAALAVLACQWLDGQHAEDPRDVLSLARVLERAQLHDRSLAEYRKALGSGDDRVRIPALRRIAASAQRGGDQAAALALWREAAAAGDPLALRQLAIHHEHRLKDYQGALGLSERGLAAAACEPAAQGVRRDFAERRARLSRKLSRAGAAGNSPAGGRSRSRPPA